ncbi:unnamed protein product, partial [Musa banksii]
INKSKKVSTPLNANIKLSYNDGKILFDSQYFLTFIGNLIYLTIIRPGIAFLVDLASYFMQSPGNPHLDAARRILK